jgi:acyl CoA:acetate/3-ketoacid CoA transferase alpha subunit
MLFTIKLPEISIYNATAAKTTICEVEEIVEMGA